MYKKYIDKLTLLSDNAETAYPSVFSKNCVIISVPQQAITVASLLLRPTRQFYFQCPMH